MPRFGYIALDHKRKSVRGTVTAESAYAARKHLRAKGIHPTEIKEIGGENDNNPVTGILKRPNKAQVVEFTSQLSTMLNSGIKLTDALSVLIQQVSDQQLKNAVTDIRDRVVTGESFADTLAEYDQFFDIIYISMVRVGEVTGTLGNSLSSIASFMEKRQRLGSKMTTAMIYPCILLTFCLVVVMLLTIIIIPKITEQLIEIGQELPLLTKILMDISSILTSYWVFAVIAAVAGAIWLFRKFISTPKGGLLKDKFLLGLPVFGALLKQQIVARFASTLSTLLAAGLSMADSLKVVAEVTGNAVMNGAVKQARERIMSGSDISTPLRDSGVLDPAIAHMVSVGEKSGELEHMLRNIAENLESKSDVVIERMSAAIEPLIIVLMTVLVGIIALATFLPIIKVSSGIQ